jgi:F-type H+-transporting ATPase subunit a
MAANEDPFDLVLHEVGDQSSWWVFFERFLEGVEMPLFGFNIGNYRFEFTKFMFLELVAAIILLAIFIPLAKKIRTGGLPTGPFWNFFETLLVFVRDEIARPNLDDPHKHAHDHPEHGHAKAEHAGPDDSHAGQVSPHHPPAEVHEGDRYVPFLWTLFMFILLCNLLGIVPFMGSATASIWVTSALAVIAFIVMHGAGMVARKNPFAYFASLWPKLDLGPSMGAKIGALCLSLPLYIIEMGGTVIKAGVLSIRLFANMFAGHVVLGMILLFIFSVGKLEPAVYGLWTGVSIASVLGVVALSLLELFVAFLQAYVFTFLTALFVGMNLYPEH